MNQSRICKKIRNEPNKDIYEMNQTRIFKKIRNEPNKDLKQMINELNKDI